MPHCSLHPRQKGTPNLDMPPYITQGARVCSDHKTYRNSPVASLAATMPIPAAVMRHAEDSGDESCPAAGFLDQSSNGEKIVCGENGGVDRSANIDFPDGHRFNAYAHALSNGAVWMIGMEHRDSNPEKLCTTAFLDGTYVRRFQIGSLTSRPDSPDYEHEWNDLVVDHQDVGPDDFSSVWITRKGSNYDVEECGSGDEWYGHIQTGKGDVSQC